MYPAPVKIVKVQVQSFSPTLTTYYYYYYYYYYY